MNQLSIEPTKLNNEIQTEKIGNYLQIIENVETELLYTASAEDIPKLMQTKGSAFLSLIELDYPYACRNDLVTIVSAGRIYSIRMDYLLSFNGASSISLKEDNHLNDMLPSLFLHCETKDSTATFMQAELRRLESLLSSVEEPTSAPPVSKDEITDETAKPKEDKKDLRTIAAFDIKDYCYNLLSVKLISNDGEILGENITITNYLVNKPEVTKGKPPKFICIVDILGNQDKHYTSVYYSFDDKASIKAPIKKGPGKRICDLAISFDSIESLTPDINICFDLKSNKGKAKIPSWMDIYAFPYFINNKTKGGLLVGKTDDGYKTHASDFKNGRINLRIPNSDTGTDIQFTLFLTFDDNKVVLEMMD